MVKSNPIHSSSSSSGRHRMKKASKIARKEKQKKEENPCIDDDWISALAKKASSTSSNQNIDITTTTKAERIQKRLEKKRRRDARKQASVGDKLSHKKHLTEKSRSNQIIHQNRSTPTAKSHSNLISLSHSIQAILKRHNEVIKQKHINNTPPKLYVNSEASIKGKAVAGQIQLFSNYNDVTNMYNKNSKQSKLIQPRKRDYGGLGLARPTIGISLRDPSFIYKLKEEFAEHVDGFFGKQRTKAMKKQLDGNMLWRRLLSTKNKNSTAITKSIKNYGKDKKQEDFFNQKVNGVKLSAMTSDQRVETMIKAGML